MHLDELVTRRFHFDDYLEAYHTIEQSGGHYMKVMIDLNRQTASAPAACRRGFLALHALFAILWVVSVAVTCRPEVALECFRDRTRARS
jgi:hypothetical protein